MAASFLKNENCGYASAKEEFLDFICPADGRLKYTIHKHLGIELSEVESMIHLGAVHVRKMQHQRNLLPWSRRIEDGTVRKGSILRIYTNPRRFPACYVSWEGRVLFQDELFLIVDKPPWLPFQPTNDNFRECVVQCIVSGLNESTAPMRKLYGIHRLDMCTSGALALAKTQGAAKDFHKLLSDGHESQHTESPVQKIYLTLSHMPLPIGRLTHWLCPAWIAKVLCPEQRNVFPQLMTTFPNTGFKRCDLEVVSCKPIELRGQVVSDANSDEYHTFHESQILLHSGRKHQIRAQAAAVGAPLVGDTLYGPLSGITIDKIYPAMFECLVREGDSKTLVLSCLGDQAQAELSEFRSLSMMTRPPEPTEDMRGSVGLHSINLSFMGRNVTAGPAWWHDVSASNT